MVDIRSVVESFRLRMKGFGHQRVGRGYGIMVGGAQTIEKCLFMEVIRLVSKDRLKTIEASMVINDMGDSIEIIIANDTFHVEAIDKYPFFALAKIRQKLESKGYYILINGSRRNVYPSGMQYDTFSAYELKLGSPATSTVNIFDRINGLEEVVTVNEQEEYFYRWIKSLEGK